MKHCYGFCASECISGQCPQALAQSCDCKPDMPVSNADSDCIREGKHEWSLASCWSNALGNNGITYICKKCGQIKRVVYGR